MDPIRLTNDFVFRYVFGRRESEPILLDLVNAVLADADSPTARDVTVTNPINLRDALWAKESILDVKALDEDGRQFDVEMQMTRDPNAVLRSLFYWATIYASQLDRGEQYETLRPVVCINLLDFAFFDELPGNHHWFEIRNGRDPTYLLTEDLGLHFVELPRPPSEHSHLQDWAQLLEQAGKEDTDMKTLLSKNPNLQRAYEEYKRCTQDRELRELALSRERFLHDQASRLGAARREGIEEGLRKGIEQGIEKGIEQGIEKGIEQGIEKGIEQGIEKGIEQGIEKGREEVARDTARRMIAAGVDAETIATFTQLPVEEVEQLRRQ
jgi:predicted transposase/invertase (TIGR01784 family)